MDYYSGGHLTHGYRHNVSAQMFDAYTYGVDRATGLIDYERSKKWRLTSSRSYCSPDTALIRGKSISRACARSPTRSNAVFMVDMAHFAGLVAGGVFTGDINPVPHAHVVTTTTHKTLRGPRGGLVLCVKEFAESVDKGCPLVIGGPLGHCMAAKAVALTEANTPAFRNMPRKSLPTRRRWRLHASRKE